MALGVHHQPNNEAAVDIQRAIFNQPTVHCGVKPCVVDDVVHMAVNIVVFPSRLDGTEDPEVGSSHGLWSFFTHLNIMQSSAHKPATCQSAAIRSAIANV